MALYAFDGTWNQPDYNFEDGEDTNTNVFRFATAYAECHGEDGRALTQQYLAGVGTRFRRVGKVIGGLTGAGGRDRVREMLEFCAEEFEKGDTTVDIIGFSRGAALALHFANQLVDGVRMNGEKLKVDSIRFLGLWDVVPAFGIPGAIIDWANDINIGWDLDLPSRVEHCAHALARHERRQAFDVHRLDPKHKHPHVRELWFRGSHSDIGGGNGNSGRNAIALRWMMEEARSAGIPFTDAQIEKVRAQENPGAPVKAVEMKTDRIDREFHEGDQVHPSAARRLEVGESKEIPVDSRQPFDFSGLMVEADDRYRITPDPAGRWHDADIECDATGWPEDLSRNDHWWSKLKEGLLESGMVGLLRRVRSANWFEVCACPGFDDDLAFPVGKGQHATEPWVCPRSGPLNFFANDSAIPNKYGNNRGSLTVTVTRVG